MVSGQQDGTQITAPASEQEAETGGGKGTVFISHNQGTDDVIASHLHKNFFISYNKADRNWAEWIAWQLEEAKYTVIIQEWHFGAGNNIVLNMHRAIEQSERVIAVLSPDYLTSDFTTLEWTAAIAKDPTGKKRVLLLIRVRECDPTGLLSGIASINLVGLDEASAREELFAGIESGVRPVTPPVFPGKAHRLISQPPHFPGNEITKPPRLGNWKNKLFVALALVVLAAVAVLSASVLLNNHNQRVSLIDQNDSQPRPPENKNSFPLNTNTGNKNSRPPNTNTRNSNRLTPPPEIQTEPSVPTPVKAGVMKWYKERSENIVDAEPDGKLVCKNQECTQMVLVTRKDSGGIRQKTPERFRWKGNKWQPDSLR